MKEKKMNRHGGPFDRGSADSYYRRGRNPHYFKGATYSSEMVLKAEMTEQEIAEYHAGFDMNEEMQIYKDWN